MVVSGYIVSRRFTPEKERLRKWRKYFRSASSFFSIDTELLGSYQLFLFAVALRPNAGHGFLNLEVSRSHTMTHHSRQDSSRRRDLYLTTHNTHNRQTSMSPVGFKTTIPAGERLQTYALDRAVTGTDSYQLLRYKKKTPFLRLWNAFSYSERRYAASIWKCQGGNI